MIFPSSLQRGILQRRYKRFLADVETKDGLVTMHCPNTGAMSGCAEPGFDAWYSRSDNKKRKYPHTLELTRNHNGEMIGINSARANDLVEDAVLQRRLVLADLSDQLTITREVRVADARLDLLIESAGVSIFVEVKSATLCRENRRGYFPDAVSVRARKHLATLCQIRQQGGRAGLVFCAQHTGIESVAPAIDIDPLYARQLADACAIGVEIYACGCDISPEAINISGQIPFDLA